ncbi:7237_t:CDS:1, partial [Racocetra persica]
QSTAQIITIQLQNNNAQLQRPQNIGGPRNGNGRQPLRPQDLFSNTSIAVQHYADPNEGTEFIETHGIENPQSQSIESLTSLIFGLSFP